MVAGEASADLHGASLLRELRQYFPTLQVWGAGGSALSDAGMEVTVDYRRLNVAGGWGGWQKVREVFRAYRQIKHRVQLHHPNLAILLDLPDFNLSLARFLKRQKIPVIYYISPQVWAWRHYRIHKIRKRVDRMLVVFPFEKEFYKNDGIDVAFVGHPLVDCIEPRRSMRSHAEITEQPRLAILPGSRSSELGFHLPILSEVVYRLKEKYPQMEIRLAVAPTVSEFEFHNFFSERVQVVSGESIETLRWADVALIASGTATLETALVGTPFCLFYRVSRSSAWLFRHFSGYKGFIGMPNVLSKREIVREFFQEEASSEKLLAETICLIEDVAYREKVQSELHRCREILGEEGGSQRAAAEIRAFVDGCSV